MSDIAKHSICPPPREHRCPRCLEQATLFVAGELGMFARARFSAHLRACGECAAAVREMAETRAALQALPRPELSAAAREELSASARRLLSADSQRRSRSARPSRLTAPLRLAALTATLATAIVVAVLYRPLPPPVISGAATPPPRTELPPECPTCPFPGDSPFLEWDPAPGDLARVADAIRGLRRPSPTSPASLSARDRTLRQVRKRMERLEAQPL